MSSIARSRQFDSGQTLAVRNGQFLHSHTLEFNIWSRKRMTSKAILATIGGALLGLSTLVVSPAAAQGAAPSTSTLNDTVGRHHQMQQMMMQDMTQQMTRMTEQMSRGQPTPEESKAMAGQMSRMSRIMHFMSGLSARPAHTDAEMRKQMDQMQTQMKDMKDSMGGAAPK